MKIAVANNETIISLAWDIRSAFEHLRNLDESKFDQRTFNIIDAAFYVIDDTDTAINEFEIKPEIDSLGKRYLLLYGVFQALQTQQEVLGDLLKHLGIPDRGIRNKLSEIKIKRALSVAHPTKRKDHKVAQTGFIVRTSLVGGKFGLVTYFDDGAKPEYEEIDIMDFIDRQSTAVIKALKCIQDKLKEDIKEQYNKFSSAKLYDVFHPSMDWMMGHIEIGITDEYKQGIARADLSIIKKTVKQHLCDLKERGNQHQEYILDSVQPCLHCIHRLEDYFDDNDSRLSESDAAIFAEWLRHKLKDLRDNARSIEEQYEKRIST